MAISASHDLATGGGTKVTLRSLLDILPSAYFDDVSVPASKIDAWNALFIDYNSNSKSGARGLKHV